MPSARAFLYPTCYVRSRSGYVASLFLEELSVLAPSEDSVEMTSQYNEMNSMSIVPILSSPLGDRLEDFKNGLKALETWGEQLGLGGNTGFETLYSALETSGNEDIQGIIGAIKGGRKEDVLMASRFFLRLSMDADQRMDQLELELERVEKDQSRISQLVEGLKEAVPGQGGSTCFIEPLNRPKERLRAWTRLFFSGGSMEPSWPLGESIATKDLLDAAYESLSGGSSPVEVASFAVPFNPQKNCAGTVAAEIRPWFAGLLELLSRRSYESADDLKQDQDIAALQESIRKVIHRECRTSESRGCLARMAVCIYPGHTWQDVLLKAAGLSEADVDACPVSPLPGSLFLV